MPSPFPGMDPYLEGELWTTVLAHLATEIARQLVPKLRPRYIALPERRDVMSSPEESTVAIEARYPGISVLETGGRPATGLLGAATVSAPLQMTTLVPEQVPHFWVEIRDVKNRRLVTAIEILSPTNKRSDGRKEYLRRRRRILSSTAHLLEIDLLRRGRRVPMQQEYPPAAYFVCLTRAERRPLADVWPIGLDHPLPKVPVPLMAGDADSELDLQLALSAIYDAGGYDMVIDYSQPPDVNLAPDAAAWADQLLRAAGKRT